MMASYWKSPYKESSHYTSRGPITSTGRFEQTLALSRAKSSILPSGQDLFGWQLPPPKRPGSSQQYPTTSNGNLKGILKTPKANLSPRLRTVTTDDSNNVASSSDQKPNPKRPSKKVSFSQCDDTVDGESELSVSNNRGFRAHYITMQRLNHSRRVEESAMRKLNRLISGGSMKNSPQSTLGTNSKSKPKISPLPVVDGKGLLTPRSEPEKLPSALCKHSSDLTCTECVNKDVETGEVELNSTSGLQLAESCDSLLVFGTHSHSLPPNEVTINSEADTGSETVKVQLPITLFEDISPRLNQEKRSGRRRSTTPRKQKPMSFQNKRYPSKLLPGRYPFNTGAIHTRNAILRKASTERSRTDLTDKPDVPSKSQENTDNDRKDTDNDPKEDVPPEMSKPGRQQVTSDVAYSQNSETTYGYYEQSRPIIKRKSDIRESRYMDKTSQILTWLKDVRQKQNFKPRNTRYVVVESQTL